MPKPGKLPPKRRTAQRRTPKTKPVLQTHCLIGLSGHLHMGVYDELPDKVRERLRTSPFNLCAACVNEGRSDYMRTIERMEKELRRILSRR